MGKGKIKKGLIIRHLVLPNNIENSKKVLKWLKENINKEVYISIMAQYFQEQYKEITEAEYNGYKKKAIEMISKNM